jgi:SnoaL-like domain
MSSSSSISSTSSSDYTNLQYQAKKILELLCNERDTKSIIPLISPNVIVQHEDDEPVTSREAFLARFQAVIKRVPDFHMEIREAVVDDRQRKVWVRSEITGLPAGVRKESIDMMTFNEEGILVKSEDCQRVRRRE